MVIVTSLLVMLAALVFPVSTVEAKRTTIIEVNPDVWVQECATVFQETCCQENRVGDFLYAINYSSYDLLKKPSGLCMVSLRTHHV